ncbi:hypothetical protein [Nitrosovibrio sp. Nv4]|uniref:hypothetical protein n=1 Tax=Nitrosovibrio sp. Nv4 TaxID=1945880 RepID=UPI000BD84390|nr:hypothetical protein [Nitrosovibrio sp. Nv4]SOD42371.1 hypothetical protein SAMN06298226_2710 [Nitrosovibrio sp. Nv4]
MKELIQTIVICSVPVSIMGMAAFLIYKQVDGWGWFLLIAALIVGSFKGQVD